MARRHVLGPRRRGYLKNAKNYEKKTKVVRPGADNTIKQDGSLTLQTDVVNAENAPGHPVRGERARSQQMEITPKRQADMIEAYTNQVQVKPKAEEAAEKDLRQPAVKADSVFISDTAKRIQEARLQLESIPDTRSDKVAEIRRRIEDGSYEIDSDKIADQMIRESLLNDMFK
jgi:negative regulator of flagellin synthesis FlgM